jgi:hypothetical protein
MSDVKVGDSIRINNNFPVEELHGRTGRVVVIDGSYWPYDITLDGPDDIHPLRRDEFDLIDKPDYEALYIALKDRFDALRQCLHTLSEA